MLLSWQLILNIAHWVILNYSCHRTKVNSQFPTRKKNPFLQRALCKVYFQCHK